MIRALMLRLGWVPLRDHVHLINRMVDFKNAAVEVQAAHTELIERLNTFSRSVFAAKVTLTDDQAKYLAAMMRQQGATEARAERMVQVFNLEDYRK